jgi:hypothetical protein
MESINYFMMLYQQLRLCSDNKRLNKVVTKLIFLILAQTPNYFCRKGQMVCLIIIIFIMAIFYLDLNLESHK